MVNEELLTYIRENTLQGFSQPDIEVALRGAGWSDADISSAFMAIKSGKSSAELGKQTGVSPAQRSTNDELARIQEELRTEKVVGGFKPAAESGIIGMIINTKIVSTKRDAIFLLVGVGVLVLGLLYWFFLR